MTEAHKPDQPLVFGLSDQLAVADEAKKACTRCGEVKAFGDYYRDARKRDGHQGMCKSCFLAGVKKYRESNKTAIAEKKRRDEKTEAGRARMERYRRSAKAKANARAAEKARREALSDDYVKRCLLGKERVVSARQLPAELVEMKRLQMATRRLARQLKESTHESSKDTDRIPEQHGRGGNAGRPAADRGEQPAGAGPQGNQRHGRGSDGKGPGLDQQQPQR